MNVVKAYTQRWLGTILRKPGIPPRATLLFTPPATCTTKIGGICETDYRTFFCWVHCLEGAHATTRHRLRRACQAAIHRGQSCIRRLARRRHKDFSGRGRVTWRCRRFLLSPPKARLSPSSCPSRRAGRGAQAPPKPQPVPARGFQVRASGCAGRRASQNRQTLPSIANTRRRAKRCGQGQSPFERDNADIPRKVPF
jgi:hypothetical protein